MSASMGHDRQRKDKRKEEEEEEEDPLDTMIKKTGCLEKHHAVQVSIYFVRMCYLYGHL